MRAAAQALPARASAAVSLRGTFRDVTGKPFNGDTGATRLLNALTRERRFLVATLPIALLNATQDVVNADFPDSAERYRGCDDADPAVVKYRGLFYVTDGHHRIMSAAADGMTTIQVRLYDLDGDTQTDFPLLEAAHPRY